MNAPIPKRLRIFIAHSKRDGDSYLEDVKLKIEMTIRNAGIAQGRAIEPICVLGRDDYAAHASRAGSWDAWAQDVVDRADYVTRDPVYDGIVVTNKFVGMATAKIVQRAFASMRSILLYCDDGILRPIREIRQTSADAGAGWEVIAS